MRPLPLFLYIVFIALCSFQRAYAQQEEEKQQRIMILLDGSSSMLQTWGNGQDRFRSASKVITSLIDSIYKVNNKVEFALRVYGHNHPAQDNNCFDTKREVMFSKDNLTQMSLRLQSLRPAGVSPIAYSIKMSAEEDMSDNRYNYSLILITDGGESCNGNICDVVKVLLEKKINFRPYIISMVDYAPLKEQYACMGDYLMVTKATDIPVVVGKIVDAYKPLLKLNAATRKLIQTAVVNAPSALKMDIPKFKIVEEKVEPVPIKKEEPKPVPAVKQDPAPIPVKKKEPKLTPKPAEIIPKQITPPPAVDITNANVPPARKIENYGYVTVIKVPLINAFKEKVSVATKVPAKTFKYVEPAPEVVTPVVVAAPPVVKPPVTTQVKKPEVKPTPTPTVTTTKPTESKYLIEREEQKETTLEVFFTDGKGKFYQTAPQVVLIDPRSGKEVSKFYRTVSINGSPAPQNIPVGTYDLTVKGNSKLLVKNVEVRANNKNKVIVQVNKASLRFEYEDDPNQPVSEYVARVKKNFEAGPVVKQPCAQEMEYEPGNYHIEINTLPIEHKSLDLDFNAVIVIKIEKPGFVRITNTNKMGKINVYYQLGDQFLKFYTLDVNGDIERQRLQLQRGKYRIGYNKTPEVPYAEETYKEFNVRSYNTTDVFLD